MTFELGQIAIAKVVLTVGPIRVVVGVGELSFILQHNVGRESGDAIDHTTNSSRLIIVRPIC